MPAPVSPSRREQLRRRLHARAIANGWSIEHDWNMAWDPELYRQRFSGPSRRARLLFPVVLSLLVQVPSVFASWNQATRTVTRRELTGDVLVDFLIAIVGPLALLFARRFPGPVVVVVAAAASADLLLAGNNDGPPYLAFAFAIGSAIVRGARVWAWITIAAAWVGTLLLSGFVGIAFQPMRIIGISFGILIVVGLAEAMRTRRQRVDAVRLTMSRRRQSEVQAERVRIARELHDVLAHSLSQINVQASVALHLIEKQPDKAAEALASIKATSKTALDEVRSVLGVLRAEDGADPSAPLVPEPDLSRLEGLAASVTAQGIDVSLVNDVRSMPQATQLAVYRIVQESLTNIVRHSHARRATVHLSETETAYEVVVRDDGTGPAGAADLSDSGGRGLLGMRERAELLGGHLTAATIPTGGFQVTASIPRKDPVT